MKRHRFIVSVTLEQGTIGITDAKLVHQLRAVLRIAPGEEIIVSDNSGKEAIATVVSYRDDAVMVEMQDPYTVTTESKRRVTIYAAVSKRDTFEWAVQKATECGATEIVPVITERTVKQNVNFVRLRAIAKEAAEQSGRGLVPVIGEVTPYEHLLVSDDSSLKLFASTQGGVDLHTLPLPEGSVAILIGPEGGFSAREEMLAAENGWQPVSLGSRVLRAETAVIIATYLLALD